MILLTHAISFAFDVMPENFWLIVLGSGVAAGVIGISLSVFEGVQ